jgi:hypothetical protein
LRGFSSDAWNRNTFKACFGIIAFWEIYFLVDVKMQRFLSLPSSPTLLPTSGEGGLRFLHVWLEVLFLLPLVGEGGAERRMRASGAETVFNLRVDLTRGFSTTSPHIFSQLGLIRFSFGL